jgi:hypothetical protein
MDTGFKVKHKKGYGKKYGFEIGFLTNNYLKEY